MLKGPLSGLSQALSNQASASVQEARAAARRGLETTKQRAAATGAAWAKDASAAASERVKGAKSSLKARGPVLGRRLANAATSAGGQPFRRARRAGWYAAGLFLTTVFVYGVATATPGAIAQYALHRSKQREEAEAVEDSSGQEPGTRDVALPTAAGAGAGAGSWKDTGVAVWRTGVDVTHSLAANLRKWSSQSRGGDEEGSDERPWTGQEEPGPSTPPPDQQRRWWF